MMYRKALCFRDKTAAAQILATDNAVEIKAPGRSDADIGTEYTGIADRLRETGGGLEFCLKNASFP